jgi:hypothetical protein
LASTSSARPAFRSDAGGTPRGNVHDPPPAGPPRSRLARADLDFGSDAKESSRVGENAPPCRGGHERMEAR